jgi:hypothetical protein
MDPLARPARDGTRKSCPYGLRAVKKNQEEKILVKNEMRVSRFDFVMRRVGATVI